MGIRYFRQRTRRHMYISYFFVAEINTISKNNLWKNEFILVYCFQGRVPNGSKARQRAGRREAKRPYLQTKCREQTERG